MKKTTKRKKKSEKQIKNTSTHYLVSLKGKKECQEIEALDRFSVLQQFPNETIEALYMESKSPLNFLENTSVYEKHLIKLAKKEPFIYEENPSFSFSPEDIEKVYVLIG